MNEIGEIVGTVYCKSKSLKEDVVQMMMQKIALRYGYFEAESLGPQYFFTVIANGIRALPLLTLRSSLAAG